jgi:hypothetical protein
MGKKAVIQTVAARVHNYATVCGEHPQTEQLERAETDDVELFIAYYIFMQYKLHHKQGKPAKLKNQFGRGDTCTCVSLVQREKKRAAPSNPQCFHAGPIVSMMRGHAKEMLNGLA